MEQEALENLSTVVTVSDRKVETADDMTDIVVVDLVSYVNVELDIENNNGSSEAGHNVLDITQGLCNVFCLNNVKILHHQRRFNVTLNIQVDLTLLDWLVLPPSLKWSQYVYFRISSFTFQTM